MEEKSKKDIVETLFAEAKQCYYSQERNNARNQWARLVEFIDPNHSGVFFDETVRGESKTRRLFDNTAILAAGDLASSIHASLTSPSITWSRTRWKNPALEQDKEAEAWLEICNGLMHDAISDSNFSSEIQKSYVSDTTLANSLLFLEEMEPSAPSFSGFRFESWAMNEVAWEEGRDSRVERVYRKIKMKAYQMIRTFGEDNLPKDIIDASKHGSSQKDKEFEVWFVCVPNDNPRISDVPENTPSENLPWQLYIFTTEGKHLISQMGFWDNPCNGFRWGLLSREVYGRGPGHIALPDVMSLNEAVKLSLRAAQKTIDPPIFVAARGVMGSLDMNPSGLNVVKDPANSVQQFQSGVNPDLTNLQVERMEQSVREAFYIDKILLPPRTEVGEQTAFEVAERIKQLQKVIGPVISRYIYERLRPMTERMFMMMLRRGAFPEPPSSVQESNASFDIEFVNPLARAQRMEEVSAMDRHFARAANAAQVVGPAPLDTIDIDGYMDTAADIEGTPAEMSTSIKARKKARQQRAQAEQQQTQIEQENIQADTEVKRESLNKHGT